MLQSSNGKSYYDPQAFKLVFGSKTGNSWTLERTDADTFSLSCALKDDKDNVTGCKFSFNYNEILNLGQALSTASLSMLVLDDSEVTLKEKGGSLALLKFLPAPQAPQAEGQQAQPAKYRPVLVDPAKPENTLPIPESVALGIATVLDSLNKRL